VSSEAAFSIFRVSPWDGGMSNGMTTHARRTLFDRTSGVPSPISRHEVMSSSSHRHHREPDNGEFIVITSMRPRDELASGAEFESIDEMLIAVLEEEIGHAPPDGEWERRWRKFHDSLAEGHIPITPSVMHVDEADVEFQVVNLGQYSAAWASLKTVTIQMWSRLVPLDGLSLVSDSDD
jgi:hypothetical protein